MKKKKVTKEELMEKLKTAQSMNSDPEVAHSLADDALVEFINDPEIKEAYDMVRKWYA